MFEKSLSDMIKGIRAARGREDEAAAKISELRDGSIPGHRWMYKYGSEGYYMPQTHESRPRLET